MCGVPISARLSGAVSECAFFLDSRSSWTKKADMRVAAAIRGFLPSGSKEKAQVANRRECESGIVPPDVAHISAFFVHGDPIFVKKAPAMAFGVGSAKVVMAFDPGSAMTTTALGFLIATDFLTAIGFNVLNASVASMNSPAVLDEVPGLDGAPAPRANFPASRPIRARFLRPTLCPEGGRVVGACRIVSGAARLSREEGIADVEHPHGCGYSTRKSLCVRENCGGRRN